MDVKDVSNVKEYLALLNRQKAILQEAAQWKGKIPKDRPTRERIISNHMMHYHNDRKSLTTFQHKVHSTLVAAPYAPSVASFASLAKIGIANLALETHHRGRYMLLKS